MSRKKKTGILWFLKRLAIMIVLLIILLGAAFMGLIYTGAFGPLPTRAELADIRHEKATLVYSSDGQLIGKIFERNRTPVTREMLPQHLIDALISTEDVRFYSHNGIDNRSLLRVIIKSIIMGNRSSGGGSTITQQLAKNLYGRADFGFISLPVNKIREAIIALRMEDVYEKDEILLLYLNYVPFGEEVFGIEAAANRYYNKSVSELDIDEAAMLVGLLKGNTYYHPRLHPERALERRNIVLKLMRDEGKLTEEVYTQQIELPLDLDYSNLSYEGPAQYFLYQVEEEAREILDDIRNKDNLEYNIEKDGLIITTTLDSRLQRMARNAVRLQLSVMQQKFAADPSVRNKKQELQGIFDDDSLETRELWSWEGIEVDEMTKLDSAWHYESMLNAGVFATDPKTGAVRVWVGGNHFRYLPYDLVLSKRMLASAFKPILYAAAIADGVDPCDYFDNEIKVYEEYENWSPENYDGSSGDEIAMWYALAHSLNIPTVDLYFRVGHKKLEEMCFLLGIEEVPPDNPSVALGTMDISLFEATRAYATFADQGTIHESYMIESIRDEAGDVIYAWEHGETEKVLDSEVADIITAMLRKAVNEGTGARLRGQYRLRADLAGKTGTSQEYSDAWFFSYTPGLACGVWVGARDPDLHFSTGENGSGSALALPIAAHMYQAMEKDPQLRKAYLQPFRGISTYDELLNCEGQRTKGAWNRFFDRLFKRNEERQEAEDSANVREDGKVKKFFKNLFKKKE